MPTRPSVAELLAVALALLVTACSSGDSARPPSSPSSDTTTGLDSAAVAEARAAWAAAHIDTYRLTVTENRSVWSSGCVWTTVVEAGVVTDSSVDSSSARPDCTEIVWTVGQLHDIVEQNRDQMREYSDPSFGDHTFAVTFNDVGVPVEFDYDLANGADEETSLRIEFTM